MLIHVPRLVKHFLTAITPATIILLAVATLLPQWLSIQFIVALFGLWSLSYSLETSAEELGTTRFITIFLVPFLTTLPELVSTYFLVVSGHVLAGVLTFVGSAVFDLFLVLPILARGVQLDCKVVTILLLCSLVLPVVALALIDMKYHIVLSFTTNAEVTIHSKILGMFLTLLGTVVTLLVAVWGTHRLINAQLGGAKLIATVITLVSAVIAYAYTCISYASIVTAICNYIPESIAGILNAYLTSLPDAIYAAAAKEEGHIDEAFGELWSCVVHDYTVVPGIALLLGGAISATLGQALYMLAVPISFALLMYIDDCVVTKRATILLYSMFVIYTVLACIL